MCGVSVLIPVHEGERYIAQTIKSIISQELVDEIIVIDNGSNDRTAEIIKAEMNEDSRIKYFYLREPGISNALNFGISVAQNEFIARIDSDDLMNENRIKMQVSLLSRCQSVAVVASQIVYIDEFDNVIGRSRYPTGYLKLYKHFSFRNPIAHPSTMYRKSVIQEIGGYRAQFDGAEDLDLWFRVIKENSIFIMNESLTSYRIHKGQVSASSRTYQAERQVRMQQFRNFNRSLPRTNTFFSLIQLLRVWELSLIKFKQISKLRNFLKKEKNR